MKAFYQTSLSAAFAAFCTQAALAQAPSYEDTVHYIQERLDAGLEDNSRCNFVCHRGGGSSGDTSFSAADLSPHVSWDGRTLGMTNCAGGAKCVRGPHAGYDLWAFNIKPDEDQSKMGKAVLHLLDLCGVRPAKPDLF